MSEIRWNTVALTSKAGASPAQGALFDDVVERHVGRGKYEGLEFLHVEARKIINRVPNPGRFPFEYTINAYRGCSHACSYCLSGDTPILMSNGRTRALSTIQPGDSVVGTSRRGSYLRYQPTVVTKRWESVRDAIRITLSDGSFIVASGDHRFLSNRGWKHVTGSEHGANRRPHLTTSNWILGTGPMPDSPKRGEEYERGYLSGMILGDGSIGTYDYPQRTGRGGTTVHRFRLALADLEALDRSSRYLVRHGVETTRFEFGRPRPGYRRMEAIRTQKKASVEAVRELIRVPRYKPDEWVRGFLAGIFDAEGSGGSETVRIANRDEHIVGVILECLTQLGFDVAIDRAPSGLPLTVRFRGGLGERVRFFALVEPAISRKASLDGLAVKSMERRQVEAIEPLGIAIPMFDITTETGDFIANGLISHNCFARPTHDYLGLNIGSDFDSKIVVKINAPDLVRHETAPARWAGHPIAMGTNTDPYQAAEGKYKLTRQIIQVLGERGNPFSILTKSPLVLRDLDVLTAAAEAADVTVDFSIGTLDESVWASSEPGTAHPQKRLDAVRRLTDAGIASGVLMAPILPGLSDQTGQLEAVVSGAVKAGARFIAGMYLHLRGPVKEHYLDWLANTHPHLLRRHQSEYATSAYAPAVAEKRLRERIQDLVDKHGGPGSDRTWSPTQRLEAQEAEQLRLNV